MLECGMGTPKQRHGGLQKMILKVKDCYINCFYPTCTLLFVSFYHRIIDTFKSLYKSIYCIVIQVYLFMYMCTSHFTYGETSNNNEILEAGPPFSQGDGSFRLDSWHHFVPSAFFGELCPRTDSEFWKELCKQVIEKWTKASFPLI